MTMSIVTKTLMYLITPLLLGMHWLTGHSAWLYVFGTLSVVTIIFGSIGVVGILLALHGGSYDPSKMPVMPTWRIALGVVYQVCSVGYLLWSESFVTLTLYLISAAIVWIIIALARAARKETVESDVEQWREAHRANAEAGVGGGRVD
jgi:hypothetical protein